MIMSSTRPATYSSPSASSQPLSPVNYPPPRPRRTGRGGRPVPVAGEGLVGGEARDALALVAARPDLAGPDAPLGGRRHHADRAVQAGAPRAAGLGADVGAHGEGVDLGRAV